MYTLGLKSFPCHNQSRMCRRKCSKETILTDSFRDNRPTSDHGDDSINRESDVQVHMAKYE